MCCLSDLAQEARDQCSNLSPYLICCKRYKTLCPLQNSPAHVCEKENEKTNKISAILENCHGLCDPLENSSGCWLEEQWSEQSFEKCSLKMTS